MNIRLNIDKEYNNLEDLMIINNFLKLFNNISLVFEYENNNEKRMDENIEVILGGNRNDIIRINNDYSYDENKVVHMYYIIKSVDDVLKLDYYKAYKIRQLFIDVNDEDEIHKILHILLSNYPFLINYLVNNENILSNYLYVQINKKLDVYITDYTFEEIEQFKVGNLRNMKDFNFELLEINKKEFFTDKNKCRYCNNIFCKASPIKNFKNLFNKKYIDEEQCNKYKCIERHLVNNNYNMLYNLMTNYLIPFNSVIDSYEKINESLNKIEGRLQDIEKRCDNNEK